MSRVVPRWTGAAVKTVAIALLPLATVPATVPASGAAAGSVTISVDGSRTFQTMTALGADINPNSWDHGNLKPALDLLVNGGVKTFRVAMDMTDWESTNDDSNPKNFNWNYYDPIYSGATTFDTKYSGSNFANTWDVIDYLHQKGIPASGIVLSFMGPGPSWMGGKTLNPALEDEWVEEVLSAAYYGYSHGHTFGLFSPDNEEDATANEGIAMSDTLYADAMDRLADRMNGLPMTGVRLIGPETSCCFDVTAMTAHPTLMARLGHFALHDYTGSTEGAAQDVKGTGKDFWMSEYNVFDQSFDLLDQGASGLMVWEGYDSVYNHAILNGLGSAPGNDSYGNTALIAYDAATRTYSRRSQYYDFAQLFRFLPIGATRIFAGSSDSGVRVEAFHDRASSRLTIVGENNSSGPRTLSLSLNGLATTPGLLAYYQTNSDSQLARGPDVAVSGGSATVTVPAGTTFTLTGLGAGATDRTPPTVSISGPRAGATVSGTTSITAVAGDDVGVSGVQFRLDGANLGPVVTTSPYATKWDTTKVANGRHTLTAIARDAAGNATTSTAVVVTVSNPAAGSVLLGSTTVRASADSNPAGEAEAFRFTATTSGVARTLRFYVDSGSAATGLAVGVYADAGGRPGTLLASGSLRSPAPSAWNTVRLGANPSLTAGSRYWLALLGTGGRLNYRDDATGNCSQSNATEGLAALPARWATGTAWPSCNVSAYVSSVAPVTTPAGPAFTAIYFDSPGPDTGSNRSLNAEWVRIKNFGRRRATLTGWTLRDAAGHVYRFPTFRLAAGATVTVHTGRGRNTATNLYWRSTRYRWNNNGDTATLLDAHGHRVDRCHYTRANRPEARC